MIVYVGLNGYKDNHSILLQTAIKNKIIRSMFDSDFNDVITDLEYHVKLLNHPVIIAEIEFKSPNILHDEIEGNIEDLKILYTYEIKIFEGLREIIPRVGFNISGEMFENIQLCLKLAAEKNLNNVLAEIAKVLYDFNPLWYIRHHLYEANNIFNINNNDVENLKIYVYSVLSEYIADIPNSDPDMPFTKFSESPYAKLQLEYIINGDTDDTLRDNQYDPTKDSIDKQKMLRKSLFENPLNKRYVTYFLHNYKTQLEAWYDDITNIDTYLEGIIGQKVSNTTLVDAAIKEGEEDSYEKLQNDKEFENYSEELEEEKPQTNPGRDEILKLASKIVFDDSHIEFNENRKKNGEKFE